MPSDNKPSVPALMPVCLLNLMPGMKQLFLGKERNNWGKKKKKKEGKKEKKKNLARMGTKKEKDSEANLEMSFFLILRLMMTA